MAMVVATSYGRIGRDMSETASADTQSADRTGQMPSFSVIVTSQNQADALRRNLPTLLTQDYADYEVIVVDLASNDDTITVLKALEYDHTNLTHTRTPDSARDINLESLAVTLGIRAARGQWVVFMTAADAPTSSRWLRSMAAMTADANTLLIGSTRYDRGASLQMRFELLWQTMLTASSVRSGRLPLPSLPCNIAIQRSAFDEQGPLGLELALRHGAVQLLANRLAQPYTTAYLLAPETVVCHDAPSDKATWQHTLIEAIAIRRQARGHILMSLVEMWVLLQPWLVIAAIGLPLIYGLIIAISLSAGDTATAQLLSDQGGGTAAQSEQSLLVVAVVVTSSFAAMLVAYVITKLVAAARTMHMLGYKSMVATFLWLELVRPFILVRRWLTWLRTPHNEFRKKFV